MRWILVFLCLLVSFLYAALGYITYYLASRTAVSYPPDCPVRHFFYLFAQAYFRHLNALLALIFLWILLRAYNHEKRTIKEKISPEDLGLLKIIKTNAAMLLDKYKSGKKVVNLDDWKEHQ